MTNTPSIAAHFFRMQNKAMQLECLLGAISAFQADDDKMLRCYLVDAANEIAIDLNNGLDSARLPEVTA